MAVLRVLGVLVALSIVSKSAAADDAAAGQGRQAATVFQKFANYKERLRQKLADHRRQQLEAHLEKDAQSMESFKKAGRKAMVLASDKLQAFSKNRRLRENFAEVQRRQRRTKSRQASRQRSASKILKNIGKRAEAKQTYRNGLVSSLSYLNNRVFPDRMARHEALKTMMIRMKQGLSKYRKTHDAPQETRPPEAQVEHGRGQVQGAEAPEQVAETEQRLPAGEDVL